MLPFIFSPFHETSLLQTVSESSINNESYFIYYCNNIKKQAFRRKSHLLLNFNIQLQLDDINKKIKSSSDFRMPRYQYSLALKNYSEREM